MSITYKTRTGDTFETVSRNEYGTETEAGRIASANPGVTEPFATGISLTIPPLPGAPTDLPSQSPSAAEDEVAVLIKGERFRFWDAVRITRSIDGMDTVGFSAPFDANLPGFREIFRPLSFPDVVITVGGDPLFTGVLVSIDPTVGNKARTIQTSGYSRPGVLNDCTSPASAFPLEFNGLNLQDIATALVAPFGLSVVFEASPGPVFDRVAFTPKKKVLAGLAGLARQRNLIISSTQAGELLFTQSIPGGNAVARLRQGETPLVSVVPVFNPQSYYSHLTGIEPVTVGLSGSQFTVKNPRLEGVVRPLTFDIPDTPGTDAKSAVDAKMGRMFGNAATYSVSVNTWRDSNGLLWRPNTTLRLTAPDAMIYEEFEFLIRKVSFERVKNAETATLDLVLPGAFSGGIPEVLPWDG